MLTIVRLYDSLAANVMPASWKSLVAVTVKNNMNLAVADQVIKYPGNNFNLFIFSFILFILCLSICLPGPVVLFRRTRDEIISLELSIYYFKFLYKNYDLVTLLLIRPGNLVKNRGNDLLIKLLEYRYPRVIDLPVLREWLSAEGAERAALLRKFEVNNGQLIQDLKQYINENSISFPMLIGENWIENKKSQMTLYLVSY